ncbi:MAG: MFS transporter [Micrococcales bacterium]|nr:MFS transporter [Micrococcales bacterium]
MTHHATGERERGSIRSLIPARLDRLPWTRFHWMIVVGLGVSWILDGLEIQIVSQNGYAAEFGMNSAQIGATGTVYLVGQVVGALVFGRLSDRLGRRKLFILTLAIYLVGSALAGLVPPFENQWVSIGLLWVARFIAGTGIGGEYAAINSAIDELIPSHYRGHVDIAINGTYWGGAALGAGATLIFLNAGWFGQDWVDGWGWRLAFFIGPVLGLGIIYLRRHIPESPRWQMTHGQLDAAEATVDAIERDLEGQGHRLERVDEAKAIEVSPQDRVGFRVLARVFFRMYPKRTLVGATMMITQSFLYNAIFFSYALALENFYGIEKGQTGLYFFPFAIGNLLGPLLLGRLFDSWGRRKMVLLTYGGSGVILAASAVMFQADALTAVTQTAFWCAAFFLASAGASAAYLTVSEIFPLEVRSQAISYFFSLAQIFGALAPLLYGAMIGDGSNRGPITIGYFLGSAIMLVGGIVTFIFGVDAERKQLEAVTDPLTIVRREERVDGSH